MSDQTNIEWADGTFNPWIGCTKVSPACDHCYAAVSTPARTLGVEWGAGKARRRTAPSNWRQPMQWNAAPFWQCSVCGWRGTTKYGQAIHCETPATPVRRRVFCASLADVFDNEVPIEWLVDLLDLIRRTPNLDWLLLTKRIGNVLPRLHGAVDALDMGYRRGEPTGDLCDWIEYWIGGGAPPRNVWLGATVVNQAEADRDIPKLLAIPAAVRFVSIEPMLGAIDIPWAFPDIRTACCHRCGFRTNRVGGTCPNDGETLRGDVGVDWVIAGGESGPHARPSHPDWFRSLRDQCAAAGVAFLFKQWGEFAPYNILDFAPGDPAPMREAIVFHPPGAKPTEMMRYGKKAAGRLLDGVEHSGFPEVRA